MLRFRLTILLSLFSLFVISTGCEINPATGKKELILISTAEEITLGANSHKQLGSRFTFLKKGEYCERVTRIGMRVTSVSDRHDIEYRFFLVDEKEMNAFAVPGGYIYATKGLVLQATDDELACVLAHEAGHIAAKHGVKHLQTAMLATLLVHLIDKNSKKEDVKAAATVAVNLLMLGYSRKHEYQADLLGVRYAWRAGYDPHGMITFFGKLQKMSQNHPKFPEFISTHPDTGKRIARCRSIIRSEMTGPEGELLKPPPLPVNDEIEIGKSG